MLSLDLIQHLIERIHHRPQTIDRRCVASGGIAIQRVRYRSR
jgi:hypothetical protein